MWNGVSFFIIEVFFAKNRYVEPAFQEMCCIWFCNMHNFRYVLMPFSNWTLSYFQVMLCWGFISLYLKYWECGTLIWKGSYYLTYFLQKAYLHCIWLGYHIQGKWLTFHVSIKAFFHCFVIWTFPVFVFL